MTFWEQYQHQAHLYRGRLAVVDQRGRSLTHDELRREAVRVSDGLTGIGLGPGHVLGVFLPNRVAWPVVALAAARSGIGVLGLNTRFRESELNHLLSVAAVDHVLVADHFLGIDGPTLMAGLDRPVEVIVDKSDVDSPSDRSGQSLYLDDLPSASATVKADHQSDSEHAAEIRHRPLIGFTTSGTTGFPKVAMHDQFQTLAHLSAVIDTFELSERSVALTPLPLCGAFGYTTAMATLLAGGLVVTHETWDPDLAAEAIDHHGVTFCSASDDMLINLVASDRFARQTSWTTGGFADFTNSGADAVAAVETASGGTTRLAGLYGSSEGFALMSTWSGYASREARVRNGGYLVSLDMSVRCCDPESGEVLDHGQPGELQFTGPNLITSYLNNPEATAKSFTEDGWYRSGDLGHTVEPDERGHQGFVFLARLGDSLRLRGFLCDPAEIEKHLEGHPAVELAQVVGVSRPGTGDVAVGFVRLSDGADRSAVDEAALLAHCRVGLANYKQPKRVCIIEEFPVTDGPNGIKIRKVELRERAAELAG